MNKIITSVALILIVIGVIGMSMTGKTYFTHERVTGEETFSVDDVESIQIDSGVASLNIKPSSTNEIKVEWEGRKSSSNNDVKIEIEGGQLNIHVDQNRLFNLFSFDFSFLNTRFQLDVYVPEKQFQSVYVQNNVGSTKISSLLTQSLVVKSDVADVMIDHVDAQSLDVTSSVGKITLEQIDAKVKARNDVGEIIVIHNQINNDMTLTNNVGNIKVKVPHKPSNTIFLGNSDIGSINIFGSKSSYISEHQDHVITMETDIGNIDVIVD